MVDLPHHSIMVDNVLATYEEASVADFNEGVNWYENALGTCKALVEGRPYTVEQLVGVMAVASPNSLWFINEESTGNILDLHYSGIPCEFWGLPIFPKNLKKAERILDEDMTAIKGLKVENFYRNILGDKDNSVTIDRWAVRVALNEPKMSPRYTVPSGKRVYNALADVYHDAATILEDSVREVQAITWCSIRNKYSTRKNVGIHV